MRICRNPNGAHWGTAHRMVFKMDHFTGCRIGLFLPDKRDRWNRRFLRLAYSTPNTKEGVWRKRQAIVAQGTVEGLAAEDQGNLPCSRGSVRPASRRLRWRAPQPAPAMDGMRLRFRAYCDAADAARSPMGFLAIEWGTDPAVPMSEDALPEYLTRALRGYGADSMVASESCRSWSDLRRAYQCGGTFEKELDGTHLAANGVVVSVWPIV